MKIINAIVLPAFLMLTGCGPKDFGDCVLQNMKGVTSDTAAEIVRYECNEKFNKRNIPDKKIESHEVIDKIEGFAVLKYGKNLSIDLYNGNSEITVTQITIAVNIKEKGGSVTRVYEHDVDLAPLQKGFAFIEIMNPKSSENFEWRIISLRGHN